MKKATFEALSESLNKAITQATRKQQATAGILDRVEPLPIFKPVEFGQAPGNVVSDSESVAPSVSTTAPVSLTPSVTQIPAVTLTPVRGITAIPNAILDSLLPQLDPYEQLVYLRLYRLSHGFRSETCLVSLDRLATACKISPSSAIRAIRELESKRLIRRLQPKLGKSMTETRGNQFWVFRPPVPQTAPVSQTSCVVQTPPVTETPIKEISDDSINKNHHQINSVPQLGGVPKTAPVTRTTGGESERTNSDSDNLRYLSQTISFYTQITKNPWLETDTAAYIENSIDQIPFEKVKSEMLTVSERAGSRINSFAYFVKEILAATDQKTVTGRRKAFASIIRRVRENHVGQANYGMADFVFDVKSACAREGVVFDNDLFNELNKSRP